MKTNITSLLNKKIIKIEVVQKGTRVYYRFQISQRKHFDVMVDSIFDKNGDYFEDDIQTTLKIS